MDANGNELTIMQDFYNIRYQNYGGYLQFQGILNEKMRFVAGGRLDYNTRFGVTVNPRVGIVVKPVDKLSVKLLYGRAYLAPSPYNAISIMEHFITMPVTINWQLLSGICPILI